jgi:hypothetical protein
VLEVVRRTMLLKIEVRWIRELARSREGRDEICTFDLNLKSDFNT